MWRGAPAVGVLAVLLAACGDAEPSTTPTTRQLPSTTVASPATTVVSSDSTSSAPSAQTAPAVAATADRTVSILVLTRTAGFRHTSIEPAAEALTEGLTALGAEVVVDPDAARVTTEGLAGVDAIVMLSTTGDWLDDAQQAAIEQWAA